MKPVLPQDMSLDIGGVTVIRFQRDVGKLGHCPRDKPLKVMPGSRAVPEREADIAKRHKELAEVRMKQDRIKIYPTRPPAARQEKQPQDGSIYGGKVLSYPSLAACRISGFQQRRAQGSDHYPERRHFQYGQLPSDGEKFACPMTAENGISK